jgi:hypothetical protein
MMLVVVLVMVLVMMAVMMRVMKVTPAEVRAIAAWRRSQPVE